MKTYTVKKGDSLWKIAKANGVSLEAVIAANPQVTSPSAISPGQIINIPSTNAVASGTGTSGEAGTVVPSPPVTIVGPGPAQTPDTTAGDAPAQPAAQMAGDLTLGSSAAPAAPAASAAPSAPASTGSTASWPVSSGSAVPLGGQMWKHVVKHGDSMWKIAKQVGVTLEQLTAANPQIADPNQLQAGQVLNIPSGTQLLKQKVVGDTTSSGVQIAPSDSPGPKELLTMPMPAAPAPIPTEVPVMEKPKFELPAMEFPKLPSVNLPNINVPSINVPINVQNQANDTIEQKTYNIGPVGNKAYNTPVFQAPVQQGPITQAPISVGTSGVHSAVDPGYFIPMHHHHHPHCVCQTVIHCPVCGCLHPLPMIHHMHPDYHMHYAYGQPGAYPATGFAGAQSPVNYGSPMVGSPGEMGPLSYQPYQPTNQSASIHG